MLILNYLLAVSFEAIFNFVGRVKELIRQGKDVDRKHLNINEKYH